MTSLTLALWLAPVARAEVFFSNPGHSGSSGVDQYSATFPSAGGPTTPGVTQGQAAQPSPTVQAALRKSGGGDKAALGALVSRPQLGAPNPGLRALTRGAPGSTSDGSAAAQRDVSFPQALQGASETPIWVMVALIIATAGALSVRLRRRPAPYHA